MSRIADRVAPDIERFYLALGLDPGRPASYQPEALWFFQHIEGLNREHFKTPLAGLDERLELRVLGDQIHLLSRNVREKHAWVNRAFFFAGTTLVLVITLAADYVLRAR